MAQEFLAVEGMTMVFENPAHSGNITITGAASTKVKAENKFIYLNNLSISISNGTDGSITNATGTGNFIATTTKNFSESQKILRENDKTGIITMTGTNPSPPPPTATYTTRVLLQLAGQTKAKGE